MKKEEATAQLVAAIEKLTAQLAPLVPEQPVYGAQQRLFLSDKEIEKSRRELEKSVWRSVMKLCREARSRVSHEHGTQKGCDILAREIAGEFHTKFPEELHRLKRIANEMEPADVPPRFAPPTSPNFDDLCDNFDHSDADHRLISSIGSQIQGLEGFIISRAASIPIPRASSKKQPARAR